MNTSGAGFKQKGISKTEAETKESLPPGPPQDPVKEYSRSVKDRVTESTGSKWKGRLRQDRHYPVRFSDSQPRTAAAERGEM